MVRPQNEETTMTLFEKATQLPQRIRANYRAYRNRMILDSLPDEIRKDIGWDGSYRGIDPSSGHRQ